MSKAPDAFRTISEVSEILETPPHVLRFWETKFTQLKPVKRAGGRRYYRPSDLELLGGIKRLLHDDGMTIRGVQKMLREKGVKHVAALSPPLVIDLEAEASEAPPAAPIVAHPARDADAPDAPPMNEPREAADDRSEVESPPMPERETKKAAEPAPPEDSQAPPLPFDSEPDRPAAASEGTAPGATPEVEADTEALAARIRELSKSESAAAAPAEQDAPPPAGRSKASRDPAPRKQERKAAHAAEPPRPEAVYPPEADTAAERVAAPPPSEGDDDARPGIATLLRRLDGPLPARVQALRPLAARMEALNARLAEADDAATG